MGRGLVYGKVDIFAVFRPMGVNLHIFGQVGVSAIRTQTRDGPQDGTLQVKPLSAGFPMQLQSGRASTCYLEPLGTVRRTRLMCHYLLQATYRRNLDLGARQWFGVRPYCIFFGCPSVSQGPTYNFDEMSWQAVPGSLHGNGPCRQASTGKDPGSDIGQPLQRCTPGGTPALG